MRKRKSKAFTLIELLAVILVLGVIALIAIPSINHIIDGVEMNSIISNMRNLIDAGEKYYAKNGYTDTSCISVNDYELSFKNKLGNIAGAICFNGSEAYLKDVMHENYMINGTTDSLSYEKIEDNIKPVFALEEETFDGIDDYYDTGYALFDEAKDFTIIVSFTFTNDLESNFNNPPTIFHCMYESSPYPGIVLDNQSANGRLAAILSVTKLFHQPLKNNKNILVIKRDASVNNIIYYTFNSNGVIVSSNLAVRTTTFDLNLLVGAYQTTAGVKGRFFKGTIHHFNLYMDYLDDTTIKALMYKFK